VGIVLTGHIVSNEVAFPVRLGGICSSKF